ncbi:MAG: hypothetical protein C4527_28795 [Candidatus Omnitrophota bacterium]|jgi:putative addiction module component (TIGR02574 family)|nr:MAG: hypothetical protein C4527_28795 [Candidatus Omnitrophota bacterium]
MRNLTKEIEEQIQGLSLPDMMALHESLIVSIQEREDQEGIEPSYKAELERRIDEINSGKVKGVDAIKSLEEM